MAKFRKGDRVAYCGWRDYASLRCGDTRTVKAVIFNGNNELITLSNRLSPIGTSDYLADQFKLIDRPKRSGPMAASERTKYFAVKLNVGYEHDGISGLILDPIGNPHPGDMSGDIDTTPLRNSQHEVRVDVSKRIVEGDKWLVVKTVCLLEGEEPRPPIRVTEYAG